MATHCSVLAWRILGTGEPGWLPSMGSHRVGHNWSDLAAAAAAAELYHYLWDKYKLNYGITYLGFPDSSVSKESSCNAKDPSSISGSRRSTGEGIGYPLQHSWTSLVAQMVKKKKKSACNAGDLSSVPGLGRSEEGKGYPFQYSGLENSMDYIEHGVAKSGTWLSNFHFHNVSNITSCKYRIKRFWFFSKRRLKLGRRQF